MSSECPVCECRTNRQFPALLDPFLIARCNLPDDFNAQANYCASCGHIFKTPMLSNEQLRKLYDGYRGAEYNQQRLVVEPGYQLSIEQFDHRESSYWTDRQAFYDQTLVEYRGFRGVVVDFGGGDGYFSKYIFPEARLRLVEESFEREGGDLPGLLSETEFLFCAHVFEHIPTPLTSLRNLTRHMRSGALVWVEVPEDNLRPPEVSFAGFERAAADGTLAWNSVIPIYHEHVNSYSARSLRLLLDRSGVEPKTLVMTPNVLAVLGEVRSG